MKLSKVLYHLLRSISARLYCAYVVTAFEVPRLAFAVEGYFKRLFAMPYLGALFQLPGHIRDLLQLLRTEYGQQIVHRFHGVGFHLSKYRGKGGQVQEWIGYRCGAD